MSINKLLNNCNFSIFNFKMHVFNNDILALQSTLWEEIGEIAPRTA